MFCDPKTDFKGGDPETTFEGIGSLEMEFGVALGGWGALKVSFEGTAGI